MVWVRGQWVFFSTDELQLQLQPARLELGGWDGGCPARISDSYSGDKIGNNFASVASIICVNSRDYDRNRLIPNEDMSAFGDLFCRS